MGLALGLAIGATGLPILMLIELVEASAKLGSIHGAVPLVVGIMGVALGTILVTRRTEAAPATGRASGPVLGLVAVAGVLALLRAVPNFAEYGRPLDALDEAIFVAALATWVVLSVQSRLAPPLLAGWLSGTAISYVLSGVGFVMLGGEKVAWVPLLQFGAPALVLAAASLVFRESERRP